MNEKKNRANTLSAILSNMEDLEGAYESALNAEGSALKENEAYLDSIQGRIDLFNNSVQTMWMNFMDSDAVKFIVDLGTQLIKLIDKIGVIPSLLIGVLTYFTAIKKNNPITIFKDLSTSMHNYGMALQQIKAIQELNGLNGSPKMDTEAFNTANINAYAAAVKNLTAEQQAAALASAGLNEAQIQEAMSKNGVSDANIKQAMSEAQVKAAKTQTTTATVAEAFALNAEQKAKLSNAAANWLAANSGKKLTLELVKEAVQHGVISQATAAEIIAKYNLAGANNVASFSFKGLTASIKAMMASNPIGWILMIVSAVISLAMVIKDKIKTTAELKQEVDELTESYKNFKQTVDENIEKLSTPSDLSAYEDLEEEFARLTRGVDAYGNNLSLTSDQYERYRNICETICDLNPSLIAGYDSATEAIGRNANALSTLIEQQKIQARNEAREYTSDENMKSFANNALNDYEQAIKDYDEAKKSLAKAFKNESDNAFVGDAAIYAMQQLGYGTDQIKEELSKYAGVNIDAFDFLKGMAQADWELLHGRSFSSYLSTIWDGFKKEAITSSIVGGLGIPYIGVTNVDVFDEGTWMEDYAKVISDHSELFGAEVQEAVANLESARQLLEASRKGMVDSLLEVPLAMEQYDALTKSEQSFLSEWIKNSGDFEINDDTVVSDMLLWKKQIQSVVLALHDDAYTIKSGKLKGVTAQDILDSIYNLDPSSVKWDSYKQQMTDLIDYLWESIGAEANTLGFENKQALAVSLGIEFDVDLTDGDSDATIKQQIIDKMVKFWGMTAEEAQIWLDSQPAVKVQGLMEVDWNLVNSKTELDDQLFTGAFASDELVATKTYAGLLEQINGYNEALKETSEILVEGMQASEEYYKSLVEMGISEEELAECIDKTNNYMVANVDKLNDLIKYSGKSANSNIKLAKTQARLKYNDLYKKMKSLVNGQKITSAATLSQIKTLYSEMNALEKTIVKYNALEQQLLGTTSAYEKFTEAQEADSEKDTYITTAEEMVSTIANAFNTGELGTEAAQEAIKAMVPENVYTNVNFETNDEKMDAIYKYFTEGAVSKYVTLEFDDEGAITSAESTLEDVKQFVEDGIAKGIFEGTIDEFTLNPQIESLEQLAETFGLTEEMAFALLTLLEKYDIGWLGGDYDTLLEQFDTSIESKIYKNTQALADLEYQFATGAISVQEYNDQLKVLQGTENELAEQAAQKVSSWAETTIEMDRQQQKVADLRQQLEDYYNARARGEDWALNTDVSMLESDLNTALSDLQTLLIEKEKLGEPTQLEVTAADELGLFDNLQKQIEEFEKNNEELIIKAKIVTDNDGNFVVSDDAELNKEEAAAIQEYLDLKNKQGLINEILVGETEDPNAELKETQDLLDEIEDTIKNMPELEININTKSLQATLDQLKTLNPNMTIEEALEVISKPDESGATEGKPSIVGSGVNKDAANKNTTSDGNKLDDANASWWDWFLEDIKQTVGDIDLAYLQGYIAGEVGNFFVKTIPEGWNAISEAIATLFTETLPETLAETWELVKKVMIEEIPRWVENLKESTVIFFTETIPECWDEFWIGVEEWLNAQISGFLSGLVAGAHGDGYDSSKIIDFDISEFADGLKSKMTEFFTETLPEKWDEFWESAQEEFGEFKEHATLLKEKVTEFFTETVPEKWKEFWEAADKFCFKDIPYALGYIGKAVTTFFTKTIPQKWDEYWDAAGEELDATKDKALLLKEKVLIFFKETIPQKWDEYWNNVHETFNELKEKASILKSKIETFFGETVPQKWNEYWDAVGEKVEELKGQVQILKDKATMFFTETLPEEWTEFWDDVGEFFSETVPTGLETIKTGITTFLTVTLPGQISSLWDDISSWISTKASEFWSNLVAGWKNGPSGEGNESGESGGGVSVNGTAHRSGTARAGGTAKSGSWGAPKTETSLVGELGPEMRVRGNRWELIGENGAEFTDVRKGDIIFNHKQTQDLLSKGYVTGRGKAFGGGSAFAGGTAYEYGVDTYLFEVNSVMKDWTGSIADDISDAADSISDAADEFREVFDWIEVRLEEINEQLSLRDARLENAPDVASKNSIITEMIKINEVLRDNLLAGAEKYAAYSAKLLADIPSEYQAMAQNGAIAIEEFVGEVDEEILNSIQEYRDWVQKGADVTQQAEEVLTTIRDLAIQRFDNAYESGDVRATVEDSQNNKLQNRIDYYETRGEIPSAAYYGINGGNAANSTGMFENSYKKVEYLTKARNNMQKQLDDAVRNGEIIRGSNEWYELVNQMYDVDAAIDEAELELEEFQNAINDLYWDNFDQLINRIDYIKNDTQSLIDLMGHEDMVITPELEEGWGADQVEWTKEGLATMGLYAQQMEIAEYEARQYAEAIDDLTADYEAGLYSENEYLEKLNELKDGQYECIESYYDAQEAIKGLQEQRVEAIKEGIEKEIEALEELIDKRKEELSAEKDLYDFQKSTAEKTKNIAEIERQLAALSTDNSAAAVAKKKQLEASLAEARADLDDHYYNRSVENQQEILDKEATAFREQKEAEIEAWDKYLENVEQLVADSLGIVQTNAAEIGATLTDKANEYNLTVSDAVLSPWEDGALAVSNYQTTFDTAMSSTTERLKEVEAGWQAIIDRMVIAGELETKAIQTENERYIQQTKAPEQTAPPASNNQSQPQSQEKTIAVGGKINAGSAKIYSDSSGSGGQTQYFSNDPIYTVLEEKNGYLKVRWHGASSGASGWFKKSDVKAYAKGSKGLKKDQWAILDELGDELQLIPDGHGRLAYMKKGTGILNNVLTERLMDLAMNPQEVLDRSRPEITAPHITNNEINLNLTYGDMVSIGEFHGDNLADLEKMVAKQFEKHTKDLNNALKRYTRG